MHIISTPVQWRLSYVYLPHPANNLWHVIFFLRSSLNWLEDEPSCDTLWRDSKHLTTFIITNASQDAAWIRSIPECIPSDRIFRAQLNWCVCVFLDNNVIHCQTLGENEKRLKLRLTWLADYHVTLYQRCNKIYQDCCAEQRHKMTSPLVDIFIWYICQFCVWHVYVASIISTYSVENHWHYFLSHLSNLRLL